MTKPKAPLTAREIEARIRAAGERANAEAEARRNVAVPLHLPAEIGGQQGPEPTRYGDWEHNGIASDF